MLIFFKNDRCATLGSLNVNNVKDVHLKCQPMQMLMPTFLTRQRELDELRTSPEIIWWKNVSNHPIEFTLKEAQC